MSKDDNPWLKNLTTKRSGTGSSRTPSKKPNASAGKLSGLRKPDATAKSSTPPSGPRKGVLARLTSEARGSSSISPQPSARMISPDTSTAGTRRRGRTGTASRSRPTARPSVARPSVPSTPSSFTRNPRTTMQPYGGPSESDPINIKRARIYRTAFPPNTPVRCTLTFDPSPDGPTPGQSGTTSIAGRIGNYTELGWVSIVSLNGNPDFKALLPCASIKIEQREPILAWGD